MQQATLKAPRLRNVRGVGLAASWAICLVAVTDLGNVYADWRTVDVVQQYANQEATEVDLSAVDTVAAIAAAVYLLASVVAAVLFIIWLVRARGNSEFLCDAKHQYSRVWAGLGWFIPIVAFWAPGQFVQNVAAASDPRTAVRRDWIENVRDSTISTWWGFWITSGVTSTLSLWASGNALTQTGDAVVSRLAGSAFLNTVSAATSWVAAIMAIQVIRKINRRQSARNPVPWWHVPA